MTTKRLIFYSLWFQIVWIIAVFGQEKLQWLAVSLVVGTYVYSQLVAPIKLERVFLMALFGVMVDYANMALGIFRFEFNEFPIWLMALWFIFVWYAYFLVPIVSRFSILLVPIFGGVGGALSYLAGEKLGAVYFPLPTTTTLLVLMVEWLLIVAVIIKVYGNASDKMGYAGRVDR
ncbi:DUF2878 domain-containing protein [Vibrio coralliilyticus]|uniref:DUF2878 domain-containing protein n=1 Tax=Vibrio coralliilyticus TaxID=190893 RepID=UPI001560F9FC|nr:DUF2878 domain-containing protein [Vibrio coralliilyticus]NRF62409.1 DUF2878 domain-containing protein [Vibrio coralliilyticus]